MGIQIKSVIGLFILSCSGATTSIAADFFTIIGPDGRPMIIKNNGADNSKRSMSANAEKDTSVRLKSEDINNSQQKRSMNTKVERASAAELLESDRQKSNNEFKNNQVKQSQANGMKNDRLDVEKEQSTSILSVTKNSESKQKNNVHQEEIDQVAKVSKQINSSQSQKHDLQKLTNNPSLTLSKSLDIETDSSSEKAFQEYSNNATVEKSHFSTIDGVQYVDNEYLEDKEFNLEGNKRFYIVSDSSSTGGRTFETVEREKGITKSVFSKFVKNTQTAQQPIVLSSTYARLNKEDVVESLEQACFSGRKIQKAKTLSIEKDEIGFWPVSPMKENFTYEVVKLDQNVENIHLSSYASRQKNPTYYWPLVVFLDQKGCVIEGVSGFKNEDVHSNNSEYSAFAGVLKKPATARYLFMTPLAESIDIQNHKLSNTGQIKLSVLR